MNIRRRKGDKMETYVITAIEEADYGCEENTCGAKALVIMQDRNKNTLSVEMTEEYISTAGIDVGSEVTLSKDGQYYPI